MHLLHEILQLLASKLYNLGSQSISTCSAAYKHTITFYTMYTYMHIYTYTTIYTHQARIPYRVYIDRYKHKYMHIYIHSYNSDSDYHLVVGVFISVEHILADESDKLLRFQHENLDGLQQLLADGCHLTRKTDELCMYVCMYICMHACMYYTYICEYVLINKLYACVYLCMYVCILIY